MIASYMLLRSTVAYIASITLSVRTWPVFWPRESKKSRTASGRPYILCKSWHFQMAVSCLLLGLFTSKLWILQSLVCTLLLCRSIVANPIIYRLVPSPSRFENRQLGWEGVLPFILQIFCLFCFRRFNMWSTLPSLWKVREESEDWYKWMLVQQDVYKRICSRVRHWWQNIQQRVHEDVLGVQKGNQCRIEASWQMQRRSVLFFNYLIIYTEWL